MRLLLLAGTWESAQIAAALARDPRIIATASLARAARSPVPLGLPTRIGGWGGEAAFEEWLRRERIAGILDTTDPFSSTISHRAYRLSLKLGIDYLQFLRAPWIPREHDDWTFLNDCSEIVDRVPPGATVLLDTDGRGLDAVGDLAGRHVYCRIRDRVQPPGDRAHWRVIDGRGPFSTGVEQTIYRTLGLDWIVLPNVGGVEESPKLDAAARLGIRIGMVRRPPQPEAHRAATIAEVMRWVRRRL